MSEDTVLDFDRDTVERVSFEYGISILTPSGTDLRIGTLFQIVSHEDQVEVDPEAPIGYADRILEVLHKELTSCVATKDGVLKLAFEGGLIKWIVRPDKNYEAWVLNASTGAFQLIVCGPGGDLAFWRA